MDTVSFLSCAAERARLVQVGKPATDGAFENSMIDPGSMHNFIQDLEQALK